ncbi:hypothetical protein FDUTEX481_01065 [Tolypothrix sp. PCC 7601]|nr:hypothetical protein FDUTEX481_01065 [Tolypothrix sp. PCC 7601]
MRQMTKMLVSKSVEIKQTMLKNVNRLEILTNVATCFKPGNPSNAVAHQ